MRACVINRVRRNVANLPAPFLDLRDRRVERMREQQVFVARVRDARQCAHLRYDNRPSANAAAIAGSTRNACAVRTFRAPLTARCSRPREPLGAALERPLLPTVATSNRAPARACGTNRRHLPHETANRDVELVDVRSSVEV